MHVHIKFMLKIFTARESGKSSLLLEYFARTVSIANELLKGNKKKVKSTSPTVSARFHSSQITTKLYNNAMRVSASKFKSSIGFRSLVVIPDISH